VRAVWPKEISKEKEGRISESKPLQLASDFTRLKQGHNWLHFSGFYLYTLNTSPLFEISTVV
jgi:hypothetical protein